MVRFLAARGPTIGVVTTRGTAFVSRRSSTALPPSTAPAQSARGTAPERAPARLALVSAQLVGQVGRAATAGRRWPVEGLTDDGELCCGWRRVGWLGEQARWLRARGWDHVGRQDERRLVGGVHWLRGAVQQSTGTREGHRAEERKHTASTAR